MFLSIDGLDGSGKSTVSRDLADALRERGRDVTVMEHPGDGFLGRTCKRLLLKKGLPAALFAAAFLSTEMFLGSFRIRRSESDVIAVRYTLSAFYLPSPVYRIVYRLYSAFMPRPDVMFFVDVDPETAMERVSSRGDDLEMFENRESMEEIRRRILSEKGVVAIDGSGTPEETASEMIAYLDNFCSNIF